jgi:hypothetical protein
MSLIDINSFLTRISKDRLRERGRKDRFCLGTLDCLLAVGRSCRSSEDGPASSRNRTAERDGLSSIDFQEKNDLGSSPLAAVLGGESGVEKGKTRLCELNWMLVGQTDIKVKVYLTLPYLH